MCDDVVGVPDRAPARPLQTFSAWRAMPVNPFGAFCGLSFDTLN